MKPHMDLFMLLASAVITCVSGDEPVTENPLMKDSVEDKDWWKKTIVYQIYPRSFQDSDGDGVGDLQGIISRLDHFQYLYVDTIWLSPIYKSPMADFGYDVADYRDIDPVFGTMEDFDQLLEELHSRGMKLIMDFIPNHTSEEHEWFVESKKGGEDNPYTDYYRWHDGVFQEDGSLAPPNNWLSIFGGSAWTWVMSREQYYLHQFTPQQPDLDYRNPAVRQQILDTLEFWIRKGVDGFRIDAINTLFEPEEVTNLNEPPSGKAGYTEFENEYLDHVYTQHQEEIHDVVREWRDLFDSFEEETGKHIYMVMEIYAETPEPIMKYYESGSDHPFNFNLLYLNKTCNALCIKGLIDRFMEHMPEGGWPSQVLGNHDNRRITTRKDPRYADALNMLLLTLPGTPTTYYGEEIGQRDVEVRWEDTQDPWGINMGPESYAKYSRDPCRAPMQWDSSKHAGFSSGDSTWIPVHPEYARRNVKVQKEAHTLQSSLQLYRALAKLRRKPAFSSNARLEYHIVHNNILSYVRRDDQELYLVILNLGPESSNGDFSAQRGKNNIKEAVVVLTTVGLEGMAVRPGDIIQLSGILLTPGDGLVLRLMEEQGDPDKEEL